MSRHAVRKALNRIPADAVIALALFACAATTGLTYLHTWGGRPQFWQPIFGPAVMWACGRGYVNPALSQTPELEDFLYQRTNRFDCGTLPEKLDIAPKGPYFAPDFDWAKYFPTPGFEELIPYQYFHLYLLGSAALIWRAFGVSWTALYPFFAVLYAATVTIGYGLFRLGMRRAYAAACALLLMIAPLHLQQLPHYRDYAKAPFVLGALLIMGYLAKKPLKWPAVVGLAGLGGAVMGTGLGFRPDVNVCLPPFLVVLLVFLPGGLWRTYRVKLAAVVVFSAAYYAAARPILAAMTAGNNQAHWVLLGLFRFCDVRLGVGSALYDFGGPYEDFYVRTLFQSYAQRVHDHPDVLYISTQAYDYYGLRYVLEIVRRFPADLATRAYASVLRVLDEMQVSVQDPAPRGVTHPLLVAAYKARVLAMNSLWGSGRYYAGLSLAVIGGYNVRVALCALFLLLYFAGYPAVQFNLRHCFHLEFLSLWALGFFAQQLVDAVVGLLRTTTRQRLLDAAMQPRAWLNPPVRNALVFCAVTVAVIVLPLTLLRVYQHRAADALLRQSIEAPREALVVEQQTVDNATVRMRLRDFDQLAPAVPEREGMPVRTDYLVMEFEDTGRPDIPISLRYTSSDPMYDFSREDLVLPRANDSGGGTARVLIPVFRLSPSAYPGMNQQFEGIEIAREHMPYFRGLYRATDLTGLPLTLNLTLPHDWTSRPLHQAFLW